MKCPGQDTRYWGPEAVSEVACSRCGYRVEFFKTDGARRCPSCGLRVVNPAVSLGCAQWCAYARECLGFDPRSVAAERPEQDTLAEKLIQAVKEEFGEDQRRVAHALRVLENAEQILSPGAAEPRVVIAAALLHDIDIREAERKHGSAAPELQEVEGPPIARRILQQIGFDEETAEKVCRIVGSHHSGLDPETPEFRIVWDADNIANLEEKAKEMDRAGLEEIIERTFKTPQARKIARERFLGRTNF